ncbi:MAG: hypothetical protein KF708_16895 [Pirellulales bacterium]|nr:hypothetical protein [Pirellulales bacterium]
MNSRLSSQRELLRLAIRGLPLAVLAVVICLSGQVRAQEEVVVEEEVTVAPAETLASEEDSAAASWNPSVVRPREVDGQLCYSRQSSDAFADPDQRLSLEAKYCFEVPLDEVPVFGDLRNGTDDDFDSKYTTNDPARLTLPKPLGPVRISHPSAVAGAEMEWLDYTSGKAPKVIVQLAAPMDSETASIKLLRGDMDLETGDFKGEKEQASREFPRAEFPIDAQPYSNLDVWDIPKSLKSKSTFYGRVIAVLKQIDGRYAVDFYGEALHPDSDCRLWLSGADHAWGRPVGIRFDEIPILKEGGRIVPTAVLDVVFATATNERRAVAFDFPLCSSPALVQLRKLSQGLASKDKTSPPPDLAKLVGEDVVDELSRRLVDGQYH